MPTARAREAQPETIDSPTNISKKRLGGPYSTRSALQGHRTSVRRGYCIRTLSPSSINCRIRGGERRRSRHSGVDYEQKLGMAAALGLVGSFACLELEALG
ncbi:uncharacterized protein J3R85_013660 [Psidium guajava]|nr:uncharacterized protein J3R85_013660 [Psidium guajava]